MLREQQRMQRSFHIHLHGTEVAAVYNEKKKNLKINISINLLYFILLFKDLHIQNTKLSQKYKTA